MYRYSLLMDWQATLRAGSLIDDDFYDEEFWLKSKKRDFADMAQFLKHMVKMAVDVNGDFGMAGLIVGKEPIIKEIGRISGMQSKKHYRSAVSISICSIAEPIFGFMNGCSARARLICRKSFL